MGFLRWSLRCIPGLSTFLLLILLECALRIVQTEWLSFTFPAFLRHDPTPVIAQAIFITYSIVLHSLTLLFPLRLCTSAWAATQEIRVIHSHRTSAWREDCRHDISAADLSDIELEQDTSNVKGSVTMAIVLPSYKEDAGILETSLRVLASHSLAKSSYDVGTLLDDMWSQ